MAAPLFLSLQTGTQVSPRKRLGHFVTKLARPVYKTINWPISFFFFFLIKSVISLGQCTSCNSHPERSEMPLCCSHKRTAGKLRVVWQPHPQRIKNSWERVLQWTQEKTEFPFLQLKKPPASTLCSVMELHEESLSVLRSQLKVWVGTCPPPSTVLCESGHTAPSLIIDKGEVPKSCSVWMLVQACQASMVDIFHKLHSFFVSIN